MKKINSEVLNEEQIKVADELDKIQIDQLHKATLNFSNNSLETKKLCVTAQIAVYTLLAGIYKESPLSSLVISLELVGFFIPVLFYAVDVVLYFYQDRLRENMNNKINSIRKRHGLKSEPIIRNKKRLWRSFINGSQVLYLGLLIASVFTPILIKFCIETWEKINGKI